MGEKVIAIDYGTKRIGIASGDTDFKIAFPKKVILNKGLEELAREIEGYVLDADTTLIIIGLPLNMEKIHKENEIMREVIKLKDLLTKLLKSVKVVLLDERLSSFEADQILEDIKLKSGESGIGRDAYAAQIILQRYFDKIRENGV